LGAAQRSCGPSFDALRFFYRRLSELQVIDGDPMASLRPPRVPAPARPRILEKAEVRAFLDRPRKPQARTIAFLLAYAELRLTELVGLRWSDVDFAAQSLRIRNRCGGRSVPLHPELVLELGRWQTAQAAQAPPGPAAVATRADPATGHLFLTREGRPLNARGAAAAVRGWSQREVTETPAPSASLLRHSLQAHMLDAGVSVEEIAAFFGLRALPLRSVLAVERRRAILNSNFDW